MPDASASVKLRLWRSYLTPILLVVALWVGALTLNPRDSICGAVARIPLIALEGSHHSGPIRTFVWSEPDGSTHADWRTQDADDRIQRLPAAYRSQVAQGLFFRPRLLGPSFWTPIVERRTYSLRVWTDSNSLTPQQTAEYRAALFDFLSTQALWGPLPPGLRAADLTTSQFRWTGVLGNLYALAGFGTLAVWIVAHVRRDNAVERARRRVLRGRCGHCGYDLSAAVGTNCPECGLAPYFRQPASKSP